MSESKEYKPKSEYRKQIPGDGERVANLIEKFLAEFPEAKVKIEKFARYSIQRQDSDVDVSTFIQECRKSEPLGTSVESDRIPGLLQFATAMVYINREEHIIWISIPDTDENRAKVDKLL